MALNLSRYAGSPAVKRIRGTFVGGLALGLMTSSTLPLATLPAMAQGSEPTQVRAAASTFSRPTKEFKFRKRYIAPSADMYNRIDYSSMPSRDALMLPNYEPTWGKQPPGQSPARPALNYQPIHPDEPAEGLKAQAQSLNNNPGHKPMANREGLNPPAGPSAVSRTAPTNSNLLPSSLTRQSPNVSALPQNVQHTPLTPARIAQIKAQADALSKKGHLAEAQEVMSRAVQEHPKETALRSELSKISLERSRFFSKQGNAQQAASQARMAIAYGSAYSSSSESAYNLLSTNLTKAGIDPRNAEARASLGDGLLAENNPLEAEIEYRQAIKLKPNPDFYIGAGNAAQMAGNHVSAKLDFQKALELNPNSEAALSRLGILRYQMHDYVGANADLTRALVMNSQDTTAAQTLIDLWQKQVGTRPQDASAHLGLARAYQVTGDLDSARKEYKEVVRIDPKHANLPAARQSFKLALAKREARKSFDLAHSLETQGQLQGAFQKATDAVELYPSEGSYHNYKALLASKLQSAGLPVYAQTGLALQSLSNLMQAPEQPPAASLPTAQALGLTGPAAAMGASSPMGGHPIAGMMAADNMYKPVSTDGHVTSMTGFLASLRNFTSQQKAAQDAVDSGGAGSAAANGLNALAGVGAAAGMPLGAALPTAAPIGATDVAIPNLAGVPGFGPSNPLPGSGLPSSLDQGQMIAQGAQAQAALAGAAAAKAPVTANSALAAAAKALANTSGGATGLGGSLGGGFANGLTSAMTPTGAEAALAAAPPVARAVAPTVASTGVSNNMAAMALGLAPQAVPTMINGVGRAASYLHKNSSATAVGNMVPQQAPYQQPQIQQGGQTSYGFTPAGNFSTSQTMPTTVTQRVVTNPGGDVATAQALSMTPAPQTDLTTNPTTTPTTVPQAEITPQPDLTPVPINPVTAPQAVANLAPPIVPAQQATDAATTVPNGYPATENDLHSLIPPGALKLYLTGVKANKSDVQLQVSLRNDSPVPLKLPSGITAVVRTGGQPDRQAKVNFASKMVGSGSTISGTIKVPGKSLDPTSDVMLPTAMLTKGALNDIHLSVPISAR